MNDRLVKMTSVVAGVLWTVGGLIVLTGVATRWYGVPAVGLLSAGAGGVLNIRGFVMRCQDKIHNAFECGRDYERSHGELRSVR